jgi:hypothetical protein
MRLGFTGGAGSDRWVDGRKMGIVNHEVSNEEKTTLGRGGRMKMRTFFLFALGILGLVGCREKVELTLPTVQDLEAAYLYEGELSAAMSGNVAEITVVQPARHLARGGVIWAKVGPYVILFSQETQDLFREYPGLAGVRAITVASGGTEVARALLLRATLNEITWRRALNIAGLARRDGTRRPALLEDLVRFGEDHTEYEYNPRYVGS